MKEVSSGLKHTERLENEHGLRQLFSELQTQTDLKIFPSKNPY